MIASTIVGELLLVSAPTDSVKRVSMAEEGDVR